MSVCSKDLRLGGAKARHRCLDDTLRGNLESMSAANWKQIRERLLVRV